MSTRIFILTVLLSSLFTSVQFPEIGRAAISAHPEDETRRLAKYLRPISDLEWQKIAGPRTSEKYQVVKGDTLWDISKRLFGDPTYWPKIWALNNGNVTNPHLINPGDLIAFLPGSGTTLPGVQLGEGGTLRKTTTQPVVATRGEEWKYLPRQSWETVYGSRPVEIDPNGFDRRSKIVFHRARGYELEAFNRTEEINPLGEVDSSRLAGKVITLGDTLFIQPIGDLQVGEVYSVVSKSSNLKSRKSDRLGHAYLNEGRIKIIGVRDGLFIANVISAKGSILRGSYVIPELQRIPDFAPIPGPSPIEGILVFDRNISVYATAQNKIAFVDRGSKDGVQPGMIFRAYQHIDPSNGATITDSDFIIDGDFMVIQVTELFSTVMALDTQTPIDEDRPVVLLTDVSDLLRNDGLQRYGKDRDALDKELDELDRLDPYEGLGDKEKRELKQLEKWESNPEEKAPKKEVAPAPNSDDSFIPPDDSSVPQGNEGVPEDLAPMEDTPLGEPPAESDPVDLPGDESSSLPPADGEALPPSATTPDGPLLEEDPDVDISEETKSAVPEEL